MEDQPQGLIEVLLDKTAMDHERDDAAMDLGKYPEQRVVSALVRVVSDFADDEMVVDSAAESLAEIWVKLKIFDLNAFAKIIPFAQKVILRYIMAVRPELIPENIRKECLEKYGQ